GVQTCALPIYPASPLVQDADGPCADIDPIVVIQGDLHVGGDRVTGSVDRGSVGRTEVEERPPVIGPGQKKRVEVRDRGVSLGTSEIDLRGETSRRTAPADVDLVALEDDTSRPTVRGQDQLLGVEHAPVDHVLVIGWVGRHHYTPHRILSGTGTVLVFFVPQDEVVPTLLTETACTSGAALRAGATRLVLGEPLFRPVRPRCHGGSEFGGLRGRVRLQTQPTNITEVGRGGIMPGGAAGHGSLLPESKDTAGVVRSVRHGHLLRGPVRRRP